MGQRLHVRSDGSLQATQVVPSFEHGDQAAVRMCPCDLKHDAGDVQPLPLPSPVSSESPVPGYHGVPVHAFNGIWGTLSLGLFASGEFGSTGPFAADNSAPLKGLLYGGGTQLLTAQFIGSAITCVATFAIAMVVMYAVNAMGLLRLSREGELEGMDLHEHGISAYPEYVLSSIASPAALTIKGEPMAAAVARPHINLSEPAR